jgi:hypothetical protein
LNSAEARRIAGRGAELWRATWEGIADVADELDAAVIVLGSRGPDGHGEDLRRQPLGAGRRARRAARADRGAATLMGVDRQAVRHLPPEPNPALVHDAQERAQSVQNRIADRITAFAGSMTFLNWQLWDRPPAVGGRGPSGRDQPTEAPARRPTKIAGKDAPRTSVSPGERGDEPELATSASASLRKRRARARGGAGAHTRRRRAYAAGAAGPAQWRFRGSSQRAPRRHHLGPHVRATAGAECRKRIP